MAKYKGTTVPTGFVPQDSTELDPNGQFDPQTLVKPVFDKLPCVLITDRCGANFFELEIAGTKYYLALRTD